MLIVGKSDYERSDIILQNEIKPTKIWVKISFFSIRACRKTKGTGIPELPCNWSTARK